MRLAEWIRLNDARFQDYPDADLLRLIHQVKTDHVTWLILNIAIVWGGIIRAAELYADYRDVALLSDPAGTGIFLVAVVLSAVISLRTYRQIMLFLVRKQLSNA
jgi:energy-converting hydrogenase Eha subunit C